MFYVEMLILTYSFYNTNNSIYPFLCPKFMLKWEICVPPMALPVRAIPKVHSENCQSLLRPTTLFLYHTTSQREQISFVIL